MKTEMDQEALSQSDCAIIRNEVGIRIRVRQNTLNLALLIQTGILVVAIVIHGFRSEEKGFSNLLLLTPFIGILFQLILLDHQVKGITAVRYLKMVCQEGFQQFYDSLTYEHPKIRWISASLGNLDPSAPAFPGALSLFIYALWYDTNSLFFWLELIILIGLQPISIWIIIYLMRPRLVT